MQVRVHVPFATQQISRLISHQLKLNFAHAKRVIRQNCIDLLSRQRYAFVQL